MTHAGRLAALCGAAIVLAAPGVRAAPQLNELTLLAQTARLPADFKDQFFDLPRAMRVEVDGVFLSDAMGVLTEAGEIQVSSWVDPAQTTEAGELARWLQVLRQPRLLGDCASACDDIVALHYDLQTSTLAIITSRAERATIPARHLRLPEDGRPGLMLHNNLNVVSGQGMPVNGSYNIDAIGSLGQWTGVGTLMGVRSADPRYPNSQLLARLYAQREMAGHFVRAGLFSPDNPQQIRPPLMSGGLAGAVAGVMVGSSSALDIVEPTPSFSPLHVTANRPGIVEILRDGVLLNSQPVEPGLQTLNTRPLPAGIYDVEVRLIEDGVVTSSRRELIYKPANWGDAEHRWRYALFAGQARDESPQTIGADRALAAGATFNYLAHPRLVLGGSLQETGAERAIGASAEWTASDTSTVYVSAHHSTEFGTGVDLQTMMSYGAGTVSLSYGVSGTPPLAGVGSSSPIGAWSRRQATASWAHRWSADTYLTSQVSVLDGAGPGSGLNAGLSVTHRFKLFGSEALLGLSVYDKPSGFVSLQRERGVTLSLSMALGQGDRSLSMSAGWRSAPNGGSEPYAALDVSQRLDSGSLTQVSGGVSVDRHGVGISVGTQLQDERVAGDAFIQRSSFNGQWQGGANLQSSLAIGGASVALSGEPMAATAEAGVIVDVDADTPDAALRVQDVNGGSQLLHPGRNFVPVAAYRKGQLLFDFDEASQSAAVVEPAMLSYHLNKGGVDHQSVRVMKTVTVLGRLLDKDAQPVGGARLDNAAGHAVSEADGVFAMEVSERDASITVRRSGTELCVIATQGQGARREGDVLMLGDLSCTNGGGSDRAIQTRADRLARQGQS